MASTGSSSARNVAAAPAQADIVVGVISHNDVGTVGAVIDAVRRALPAAFASADGRIVLADAGSRDGTLEAARAATATALIEVDYPVAAAPAALPYHGRPGRAHALRLVLQTAQRLGAKGLAVLDAGLQSVTPVWLERLIGPVLTEGVDYVSAYFARRVYEGAITKGIVYPMFRALYGVRLRQPAAAEFGCSGRSIAHFLGQDFWDADQAEAGIDLWLAVAAACGGLRIAEASLGTRTTSREAPSDASTALAQIVGALYADLEHRPDVWQRTRRTIAVPIAGDIPEIDATTLNAEGLIDSFRLGYRELREIWTWVLPPRTIIDLRRLSEASLDRFRFDDELWASIIYDFALGYSLRVMPHEHLLRSLTPLYNGWLGSFVAEMNGARLMQIEDRIEQVCVAFETGKRHLISGWRWPERLR